jgi:hypothetical protein
MKLKRKPIFAKYSAEIEDLYARDLHPETHEPAAAATVQPARARDWRPTPPNPLPTPISPTAATPSSKPYSPT